LTGLKVERLYSTTNAGGWEAFASAHPNAHLLQSANWGKLKSAFGWSARIVAVREGDQENDPIVAGAQILFRRLPFGLGTMAYIPAGPLFCGEDPHNPANLLLWQGIDSAARKQRAAFLKVEPCNWYRSRPNLPAQLQASGLHPSLQTIQPPRTVLIDLTSGEEAVLKRMNQSTRYKSKLGPKKEVAVREGTATDLASFNALMAITGQRDQFGVHSPDYYRMAFDLFSKEGQCALLLAAYAGRDLAGVMAFRYGSNAYYLYGASSDEERNRMPTYIVQWAAIQWAMRHGAQRYDLWGVPDAEPETLEAEFEQRHEGLWGVYGFKRGFGGQVIRSVGAWDKAYNPALYALYKLYARRRNLG
jgi:lipid II:glycine glycyltransferase (peptidoglycan interpeptide bridge formation enzyme)